MLILSLSRLYERIDVANFEFYLLIKHIYALCTTYQLSFPKHTPQISNFLNIIAGRIMKEITLLQAKFKDGKNLPYEFQSRLVALLPPGELVQRE
uniref:NR LBD domain-containing protein n=1 Tax=Panagrellus redivivus TaxID=6233 RepID=A0A7E4WAT6_PANRE